MEKAFSLVEKLYDKKINASGLALFRVGYSVVLFCEILQLYRYRHLVFDKVPFLVPGEMEVGYGLAVWMLAVVFVGVGLFTRQAALVSYLMSLVYIGPIRSYEYHMFYAYMGVNFLLIFLNTAQVGSLDRLIQAWKHSAPGRIYEPQRDVSVINYYAPLVLAAGFVYFDSIFYKLASHNWSTGIGMWLPASLPQITRFDGSWLLNQKWLAISLGYLTVLFEAVFIFTFFRKGWRVPLLFIGAGLHLGIVLEFPIPWFGLGVLGLYALMVPVSFWGWLGGRLSFSSPRLIFYYDAECPLCIRTVLFLRHFDFLAALGFRAVQESSLAEPAFQGASMDSLLAEIHGVTSDGRVLSGVALYRRVFLLMPLLCWLGILLSLPGLRGLADQVYRWVARNRNVERCSQGVCGYSMDTGPADWDKIKVTRSLTFKKLRIAGILGMGFFFGALQLLVTYDSLLLNRFKVWTGFKSTTLSRWMDAASAPVMGASKVLFGITHHGVFMDSHFSGYNHILALEAELPNGRREWLPIIDRAGQPGKYLSSFVWVKWTFRVVGPRIQEARLKDGVRDFATFWAHCNGHPLEGIRWRIYLKKVEVPMDWRIDFLRLQKAQPWAEIGSAEWRGGAFHVDLPDVEAL
jgi:predicted DCC family thiol-disulfide oxidoreductase YuxK